MTRATALDYAPYLSRIARSRRPSPIRALIPLLKEPGMISLGAGLPNPGQFPFKAFSFTTNDGLCLSFSEDEISEALQYSPSAGIPRLIQFLGKLQVLEHGALRNLEEGSPCPWEILITTGSQEGLSRAFEMLLDPGDPILVESPCYSGALSFLRPFGAEMLGVPMDEEGIIPEAMEDILLSRIRNGQKKPRVLYTVPTGQNPSGVTMSPERKQEIYNLAQHHQLLILEDDPYYFLHQSRKISPMRSFLSLDLDGRVLRFDSFSKVLSSGIRVGWSTGPSRLIHLLELHAQSTNLHPSGLSQATVAKLLEAWGHQRFLQHLDEVSKFYQGRRDAFLLAASRNLKDLASWNSPECGMFLWIKLLGIPDSKSLIEAEARRSKVLLLPGEQFLPNASDGPSSFVRAAFSTASDVEMDIALSRLADLLRKCSTSCK